MMPQNESLSNREEPDALDIFLQQHAAAVPLTPQNEYQKIVAQINSPHKKSFDFSFFLKRQVMLVSVLVFFLGLTTWVGLSSLFFSPEKSDQVLETYFNQTVVALYQEEVPSEITDWQWVAGNY